jgi:hypothetical protein
VRRAQAGRISRVLLYALVGAIAGSFLGALLARYWPPLGHPYISVGANPGDPWTLNLNVVGLALGLWFRLNLGGIAGVLLAVGLIARRA